MLCCRIRAGTKAHLHPLQALQAQEMLLSEGYTSSLYDPFLYRGCTNT